MDASESDKRDLLEKEPWMNVRILKDTLKCPVCFDPLNNAIYQCSEGHIICSSCLKKILDKKCYECCIETSFKRCAIMEHVVQSVAVPCCNAKYGCREGLAYYQKERHEQICPTAPCLCPVPGCSYVGLIPLLLDHLTFKHSCPSTVLQDSDTLSLRFEPGLHVLRRRSRRTNYIFLLNMDLEPFGYAISVVCVQRPVTAAMSSSSSSGYSTGGDATSGTHAYISRFISFSVNFSGLLRCYFRIRGRHQLSGAGNGGSIILTCTLICAFIFKTVRELISG